MGPALPTGNPRDGGGFSLLEAVVALGVTSVILVGVGSALLLAGHAMPDARGPAAESVRGAGSLESIVTELQYAVTVPQRSAHMIEFTVADRTGDGTPEVIQYGWSGVAGAPLTRQYNGGAAVEVLPNVHEFSLTYDLQTISTEVPQPNESAETLLIGYSSSQDYYDYPIRELEQYSEYIRPVLPADTISWKVTRVRVYAKQSGSDSGRTSVQLQVPTAGHLPSGVVLEEKTLRESDLWLLYLSRDLTYTQVSNLSPQQGLCLVLRWVSGDDGSCYLLGQNPHVTAPNLALLKSVDKSVTWQARPGESLLFSVYGTVTTAGTPQIQNTYYLDAVTVRVQAGPDDQATLQTSVRTVNRPEVTQ